MLHQTGLAPAAPPPLFSVRLRLGTHAAHEAIEANPRFARLMAPDLTRAEYRALTARMYGFHAVAEAMVADAARLLPADLALERRLRRTWLLANDLRALGVTEAALAALPRCPLAPCGTAEEAWGLLYLLEGSSLGGQLIARHLAATLGLGPETGAGGMTPHGEATGALWRGFKQALDQAALAPGFDPDAMIAAANHGFTALDTWVRGAW